MRLRWTCSLASAAVLGLAVSVLAFCPCHQKGSGLTKADKDTPNNKTVQSDDSQTKPSTVVTVSDKVAPAAKAGCCGGCNGCGGECSGCGGGCGGCAHAAAKSNYKHEAARSSALAVADKPGASKKTADPSSKRGCGGCGKSSVRSDTQPKSHQPIALKYLARPVSIARTGYTKQGSRTSDGNCPKCHKGSTVSAGESATNGKVQAILASLPSLSYRVGSETVGCPVAAKAMADKAGAAMQFVVGDKVFDKEGDAIVALTSILEDRLSEMKTVQYSVNGKCGKCPVTAKRLAKASHAKVAYRVAGLETFDKAKAEEAAKLVQQALADVAISYKVGDATFCCDKMAGAKAKEAGKPMLFVVGSEQTPCETTARMLLARTKVRTAVETAAALLLAGSMG